MDVEGMNKKRVLALKGVLVSKGYVLCMHV